MKAKIAYALASLVVLTAPALMLTAAIPGCGESTSVSIGPDGSGKGEQDSPASLSDGGGAGNDGGPPIAPDGMTLVPLTATNTGYVSPANPPVGTTPPNDVGVTGAWYAYGDSWGTEGVDGATGVAGERGNCQLLGGFPTSSCSAITSPAPAAPPPDAGATVDAATPSDAAPPPSGDGAAPNDASEPSEDAGGGYATGFPPTPADSQTFCLSGTAAKVLAPADAAATDYDYSDMFGIGLGFDFNNSGTGKMPYDATAHRVVGIHFHIASAGSFPALRVEFPTSGTNDAGGGDSYIVSPTAGGDFDVLFSDLAEPYPPAAGTNIGYAAPAGDTIPMFDPTQLLSIQFHVWTNPTASIPVNQLCVSDLSAIVTAAM